MENKIQFRNHFSIIFEKSLRGIALILFAFVGSFISDLGEMETSEALSSSTILLLVLLVALFLVLGYQTIVWAKTTITISDNMIAVERKTLNRKVNTISIKSISNVNLEENMIQMLLGTSTVKLDTNSLSTADETDVTIVLKKKDAEAFRQTILNFGKEEMVVAASGNSYAFTSKEMFRHGLFSTSLLAVVILIGAIWITVVFICDALKNPAEELLQAISTIIMFLWFAVCWIWVVAKKFVKYAEFKIERRDNKIFLSYGIFKKVAYSIPVDKINAVKINQTWTARMSKYYAAEVVNVGIEDDEKEEGSFFLPYVKKDQLKQLFDTFLPEFSDCLEFKEEKQPGCIWKLWIPTVIIYLMTMVAVFGIAVELALTYMGDSDGFEWVVLGGIGILTAFLLICKVAAYYTRGCSVQEKAFQVVSGRFYKETVYMKYDKIQYLEIKQNILARRYGIQKGCVHILASSKSQTHPIPYCRQEVMDKLKIVLLAPQK